MDDMQLLGWSPSRPSAGRRSSPRSGAAPRRAAPRRRRPPGAPTTSPGFRSRRRRRWRCRASARRNRRSACISRSAQRWRPASAGAPRAGCCRPATAGRCLNCRGRRRRTAWRRSSAGRRRSCPWPAGHSGSWSPPCRGGGGSRLSESRWSPTSRARSSRPPRRSRGCLPRVRFRRCSAMVSSTRSRWAGLCCAASVAGSTSPAKSSLQTTSAAPESSIM